MHKRGMTLIDVVVGVSIMLVIFLAIFGAFKISIELVFSTKAKTGAISLITERMEYIRGLPYASVGTVGGIPPGDIPQLEQVSLNNITYTLRTLVQYEDAPEDGLEDLDENGITADYKTVKVEALWSVKDSLRSTYAISRVAPVGEESLDGGGTLRINAFDASASPIQGASVHIVNNSTNPAIDISVSTNSNGSASFPGAPEASEYEITVTKDDYSTSQTYAATVSNPNPSPGHVSVVESQTTTVGMAIDVLGSLKVLSYEPKGPGSFEDLFTNSSKILDLNNTEVSSGALTLFEDPVTGYALSGSAFSNPSAPNYLANWESFSFNSDEPVGTSAVVKLYYQPGADYVLVPDEDLPNNSIGFSAGTIDISSLDVGVYTTLQLGAFLDTNDASTTPKILDWKISYKAGPTPLPNVDFNITGTKTIGTNSIGQPIYKYEDSFTTTQFSQWLIDPIEWDTYSLTLPGSSPYVFAERCPNTVSVSPGSELDVSTWLVDKTDNSLRVIVESDGVAIDSPTVSFTGPSSGNETGSACGQAFWGDLSSGTYSVVVSKSGYQTHNEDIGVSGETTLVVNLVAN